MVMQSHSVGMTPQSEIKIDNEDLLNAQYLTFFKEYLIALFILQPGHKCITGIQRVSNISLKPSYIHNILLTVTECNWPPTSLDEFSTFAFAEGLFICSLMRFTVSLVCFINCFL